MLITLVLVGVLELDDHVLLALDVALFSADFKLSNHERDARVFHEIFDSRTTRRVQRDHLRHHTEYFVAVVRRDPLDFAQFDLVSKLDLVCGFERGSQS